MKVTILGTGTSQGIPVIGCQCKVCSSLNPKDKRLRVSVHIETDNNKNFLIDCSPDFRQQFLTNNLHKVDAVLVTHEHNDHIIGLDDLRPIIFKQGKVLPIYAMKRVIEDVRRKFHYAFKENPYPGAPRVETHIINDDYINIEGNKIVCIDIMHGTLPILAYRFDDFAYITDIKTINEEEKKKLTGLKVLIISTLRIEPHFSHMNLEEALSLINELKPEKTYLSHMGHTFGTHEELMESLPANVYPAYDGLVLNI